MAWKIIFWLIGLFLAIPILLALLAKASVGDTESGLEWLPLIFVIYTLVPIGIVAGVIALIIYLVRGRSAANSKKPSKTMLIILLCIGVCAVISFFLVYRFADDGFDGENYTSTFGDESYASSAEEHPKIVQQEAIAKMASCDVEHIEKTSFDTAEPLKVYLFDTNGEVYEVTDGNLAALSAASDDLERKHTCEKVWVYGDE